MENESGDIEVLKKTFRENLPLALELKRVIGKYAEVVREKEKCELIKIMNFCGTHEWTTTQYGLKELLPPFIELVAGPGCPVCVVPSYYVDVAVKLAQDGTRIYTYGDSLRLRSSKAEHPASLEEAKAEGGDVKVVYSFLDAVKDARSSGKEGVFFGIGFETTAPSYAIALKEGMVPGNLKFLSALRLTPAAMKYTIKLHQERGLLPISGVIAPGHVSTIIGAAEWEFLPKLYGLPTVVAGFEPIDVLMAVAQILLMMKDDRPEIKVEYRRMVGWGGNEYAKRMIDEVFEKTNAAWRGIGFIPGSGLKLREKFQGHDALKHHGVPDLAPEKFVYTHAHHGVPWEHDLPPKCRCGEVVVGIAKPTDCQMFMNGCSPASPWGPCMVSSEGVCAVWARHGGAEKLEGD
ncbi:MAG: hydrogenase formation protein HypD [Candidatus Hadarchaeota archaeon]